MLFQISGNGSEFSEAIVESTLSLDSLNFDHVGIFFYDKDHQPNVIEASPQNGVTITPLHQFLNSSPMINNKPGLVVKRLNIEFPVERSIRLALDHLGEPYDWFFLPDNGKMYCSELVYESFLTENGDHIFQSQPMNFRAPDGTMPEFWVNLYNELGVDIPEGIPGTNPNDLFKSSNLIEIPFIIF